MGEGGSRVSRKRETDEADILLPSVGLVGANAHIGPLLSSENVYQRDDEGIVPYRKT